MYQTITANLMVKNIKDTIEFYEDKLEFKTITTVPEGGDILNFAILGKDKITIMLQEQQNLLAEYSTLQNGAITPKVL